jgi:hypothetical protein
MGTAGQPPEFGAKGRECRTNALQVGEGIRARLHSIGLRLEIVGSWPVPEERATRQQPVGLGNDDNDEDPDS